MKVGGRRVETPVFMPVATAGTIKALPFSAIEKIGYDLILFNAFHFYCRPGAQRLKQYGSAKEFSFWDGALLTDSGGFQVFSLSKFLKVTEDGVQCQSPYNGDKFLLRPEDMMAFQGLMGSDIAMVLDECAPYPCDHARAEKSMELTHRWAERCVAARAANTPAVFGIAQGSSFSDLRKKSVEFISGLPVEGLAIGGLSVGEPNEIMYQMLDEIQPVLPNHLPRYLMGVGKPENLVECIHRGMDMFDCVYPTRVARNGLLFSFDGPMNILNARYQDDTAPVEAGCPCELCQRYSRAYIRHLLKNHEICGLVLATLHNLTFIKRLMIEIRSAIKEDRFPSFRTTFHHRYGK